jgi:hypothetical protein
MCNELIIPQEYHNFYRGLETCSTTDNDCNDEMAYIDDETNNAVGSDIQDIAHDARSTSSNQHVTNSE